MKKQLIVKVILTLFLVSNSHFSNAQKPSKVELPSTYDFDYEYKLKMTHKKDEMTFDYYLKKDAEYFGFNSDEISKTNPDAKMFMVLDTKLKVTAMFMEIMGKKVVQKSKMNASDYTSDDEDVSKYTFTQIESKTINNYECEGYVTESDKIKITFYITDDAPVSFTQVFGSNIKSLPKGFDPSILKKYKDNGLMMEMIYEDKKKPKNNVTVECIGLEKKEFSINTTEYGSMLGAFGG